MTNTAPADFRDRNFWVCPFCRSQDDDCGCRECVGCAAVFTSSDGQEYCADCLAQDAEIAAAEAGAKIARGEYVCAGPCGDTGLMIAAHRVGERLMCGRCSGHRELDDGCRDCGSPLLVEEVATLEPVCPRTTEPAESCDCADLDDYRKEA